MMKAIEQFLTINLAKFADKPALVEAYYKLKGIIAEIETHVQTQAIDTTADTTIKTEAKDLLTDTTLKVAAGMKAVAAAKSDTRLKMIADVSRNSLNRMRETDYVIRIRSVHEAALPIATELIDWEVTQADVDYVGVNVISFMQRTPDNRNVETLTIQATADIKAKITAARVLLRDIIDPLMLPYQSLDPTFHGQYLTTRNVLSRAATHVDKTKTELEST